MHHEFQSAQCWLKRYHAVHYAYAENNMHTAGLGAAYNAQAYPPRARTNPSQMMMLMLIPPDSEASSTCAVPPAHNVLPIT